MVAAKEPKPVRLADDRAPDRSGTSLVTPVVMVGEAVALWQLTQLAEVLWLRVLAWALFGFIVFAAVARPWASRRMYAVTMARWRALRRIQRIEPADFMAQLQSSPQEQVAFNVGVLAVTQHIGEVIAEEERRAGADLKDGVA